MRRYTFRIAVPVIVACAGLLLAQLPAGAIEVSGTPSPVTGNATWFSGVGGPYGGCGLPGADIDSQNYIALNVQNSPGDYNLLPRPIPAADASEIGMFDNGLNCGRWVQVTIGDNCNGINDGAQNEPFCRGGSGYVADQYNGATLDMVVADSCDDPNAWCKDDPYHIDLHQSSLNSFILNGQPVGNMYPDSWNNRHVSWQFIPAPGYTGDISIGAITGAQPYWPAIAISHLANGIHGVQYYANGTWTAATMDSDMGDDYIIAPTTGAGTAGSFYEIRVVDASDNLVSNGRVYSFSLPASCLPNGCTPAYTPVSYTTSTAPVAPPPATGTCTLTSAVANSWSGGAQLTLTVTNSGTSLLTGWTAGFTLADTSETVTSSWNATVTQSGDQVTADNASFNGSVAAGTSATFGVVVTGSAPSTLSRLTCAPA